MIYLDANVIIRLIEGDTSTRAPIAERLAPCSGVPASVCSSILVELECFPKPIRDEDQVIIASFEAFFSAVEFSSIEIDSDVIDTAIELRAWYNFKSPDAIHLATAINANCSVFLTGDKALARCDDIPVEVL